MECLTFFRQILAMAGDDFHSLCYCPFLFNQRESFTAGTWIGTSIRTDLLGATGGRTLLSNPSSVPEGTWIAIMAISTIWMLKSTQPHKPCKNRLADAHDKLTNHLDCCRLIDRVLRPYLWQLKLALESSRLLTKSICPRILFPHWSFERVTLDSKCTALPIELSRISRLSLCVFIAQLGKLFIHTGTWLPSTGWWAMQPESNTIVQFFKPNPENPCTAKHTPYIKQRRIQGDSSHHVISKRSIDPCYPYDTDLVLSA